MTGDTQRRLTGHDKLGGEPSASRHAGALPQSRDEIVEARAAFRHRLPVPSSAVMIAHGALFGVIGGTLLSLAGFLHPPGTCFRVVGPGLPARTRPLAGHSLVVRRCPRPRITG